MSETPSTYTTFIKQARAYANEGEDRRLDLLLLLLEAQPRKAIWHSQEVRSWDLFLRNESLCTPGLYHAFKRAKEGGVDVKGFGVYASAAIIQLPTDIRNRIVKKTEQWMAESKIPPTYQRIAKYVRDLRGQMGGTRKRGPGSLAELKAQNNRLTRQLNLKDDFIDLLKRTLRDNNVRIPKQKE